ncbi:Methylenetetrahydrofolate reductase (NADPH) [Trichinella pseudospiralis]
MLVIVLDCAIGMSESKRIEKDGQFTVQPIWARSTHFKIVHACENPVPVLFTIHNSPINKQHALVVLLELAFIEAPQFIAKVERTYF